MKIIKLVHSTMFLNLFILFFYRYVLHHTPDFSLFYVMQLSKEIDVHLFKTEFIVYKQYLFENIQIILGTQSLNLSPIMLSGNILQFIYFIDLIYGCCPGTKEESGRQ